MTAARCLVTFWLMGLCGCYTYDPAILADVRPEMRVRARLSADELARLGSVLPSGDRIIEGEVLERAGGETLLLVPVTSNVIGARVETFHQRLLIPDGGIIEIESRRLDGLKTGLVVGAGVAVAGGIAAAALAGGFRSDRPGNGGTPPEMVIPLGFSIRFGR